MDDVATVASSIPKPVSQTPHHAPITPGSPSPGSPSPGSPSPGSPTSPAIPGTMIGKIAKGALAGAGIGAGMGVISPAEEDITDLGQLGGRFYGAASGALGGMAAGAVAGRIWAGRFGAGASQGYRGMRGLTKDIGESYANAPRSVEFTPSKTTTEVFLDHALDRMTKKQLYTEAQKLGIPGRSKMNKAALKAAVTAARSRDVVPHAPAFGYGRGQGTYTFAFDPRPPSEMFGQTVRNSPVYLAEDAAKAAWEASADDNWLGKGLFRAGAGLGAAAGGAVSVAQKSVRVPRQMWTDQQADKAAWKAREGSNWPSRRINPALGAGIGIGIGGASIYGAAAATGVISGDPGHPYNALQMARSGQSRTSQRAQSNHNMVMRMATRNPRMIGQRQLDRAPGISPGQFGDAGDLVFAMHANRRG